MKKQPDSTATAGADIFAKVTVPGEGSRGSLTKKHVEKLGLEGPNPQVYAVGVKEIWDRKGASRPVL
jgi:flavin-dependent dehydrogenase